MELRILSEPPGPDILATCPSCKRRLALKLESTVADVKVGRLRTYACRYCNAKFTFADHHPPGCV